jgi:ech hydrogenase subunit D
MTMKVISTSLTGIKKMAADMKGEGRRLVVITCTATTEKYEITYSFDKDDDLVHYRLTVPEGEVIPSIGASYSGAFVYENEIHDLYGFSFSGMTLDFGGTFIRTSIPYPFKKRETRAPTITKVSKEGAS